MLARKVSGNSTHLADWTTPPWRNGFVEPDPVTIRLPPEPEGHNVKCLDLNPHPRFK